MQIGLHAEHTRERIGRTVGDHCRNGQTTTLDVSKLVACISDQKPEQQLLLFKTALTYCQQRAGDSFVNLCRSGEACDAFEGFEGCMRANSGAVAMCADNVARGIAQGRVPRCFAYMLHPGLFAGAGVGRSACRQARRFRGPARRPTRYAMRAWRKAANACAPTSPDNLNGSAKTSPAGRTRGRSACSSAARRRSRATGAQADESGAAATPTAVASADARCLRLGRVGAAARTADQRRPAAPSSSPTSSSSSSS